MVSQLDLLLTVAGWRSDMRLIAQDVEVCMSAANRTVKATSI